MSRAVFETDPVEVEQGKRFRLAVYCDAGVVSVVGEIEEVDQFGTWRCAVRCEMPDETQRYAPQWAHLCRWNLTSVSGTPHQYRSLAQHWAAVMAGHESAGLARDPEAAFKRVTVFGAVEGDTLPDFGSCATRDDVEFTALRWCNDRERALSAAFHADFEPIGLLTWGGP